MMFSNLKNSVNTGNGILEGVDFKILLGSMSLDPLDISHALVLTQFIPLLLWLAATGTSPSLPIFFVIPTPLLVVIQHQPGSSISGNYHPLVEINGRRGDSNYLEYVTRFVHI